MSSGTFAALGPGIMTVPGRLVLAAALCAVSGLGTASEQDIRPWGDLAAPIAPHLTSGAWTLVMFWSVNCQICAAETPALNAFYDEERERGVHLLGVSIDGPGMRPEVARWMQRYEMWFPTLLGDLPVIAAYFSTATEEQFLGTPTFMIFDPRARLVGVNPGPVRVQAVRDFIARKRNVE